MAGSLVTIGSVTIGKLVEMGRFVTRGSSVGLKGLVGDEVGVKVGDGEGKVVGEGVGAVDGEGVGLVLGEGVGKVVGDGVGSVDGDGVGESDVGTSVSRATNKRLFPFPSESLTMTNL